MKTQKVLKPIVHHDRYTYALYGKAKGYVKEVLLDKIAGNKVVYNGWEGDAKPDFYKLSMTGNAWMDGDDLVISGKVLTPDNEEWLRDHGSEYLQGHWTIKHADITPEMRQGLARGNLYIDENSDEKVALLVLLIAGLKESKKEGWNEDISPLISELNDQFEESIIDIPELKKSFQDNMNDINSEIIGYWSKHFEEYVRNIVIESAEDAVEFYKDNPDLGDETSYWEDEENYLDARLMRLSEFVAGRIIEQYRQQHYTNIGITDYIWETMMDDRVRPDHQRLHGEVYSFTNPPVVNTRTGLTANPGYGEGCRCSARPIYKGTKIH